MDRDKDAKLTFDEFVEGSKHDPTIVQVRRCAFLYRLSLLIPVSLATGLVTLRWLSLIVIIGAVYFVNIYPAAYILAPRLSHRS